MRWRPRRIAQCPLDLGAELVRLGQLRLGFVVQVGARGPEPLSTLLKIFHQRCCLVLSGPERVYYFEGAFIVV